MQLSAATVIDYVYENFEDECITVYRPKIIVNNVVLGSLYVDFDGTVEAINHRTGEKAIFTFYTAGWSSNSKIEGKIFDADGNERYKL